MRLSFPHGEHADVVADDTTVSIGTSPANHVVLDGGGVSANHARLVMDRRGCILEVLDSAARTHVNARPVRERAFLRPGDVLCLGAISIALKQDRDESIVTSLRPAAPAAIGDAPPARVVLRGINGPWAGKSVAIDRCMVVGRDAGSDVVVDAANIASRHAAIENHGDTVYLRDLGSDTGTLVNGIALHDAVLHSGDQVVFDQQRFVIEAPGLPVRGSRTGEALADARPITQIMQAVQVPVTESPPAAGHSIWWLIGTAAVIGVGIAALLLFGNR